MKRFRRLRKNELIRDLVRETTISVKDLVYPIFVIDGENIKNPIPSMPNVYQYSIDRLSEILDTVVESGVTSVILFGIPSKKDSLGTEAYSENGITQRAVRFIKEKYPQIYCIVDVCLCEYTSHGHCGVIKNQEVINDETLPLLGKIAVSLAKSGADMIAPSDMMDGRVKYIRDELDKEGYYNTPIMAYSAKFASSYYGPFRDAANSAPQFGDRKSYQMDYANGNEAQREIITDIEEGADIIMVKPALAYLDVLKEASINYNIPLAVYNVSGEYSMVKAASEKGWIDEKKIVIENMIAMKRAGAKIIISYHSIDVANWIKEGI